MIKVIIADDHPLFREGVTTFLNSSNDMEVIAQAENGKILIERAEKCSPDVAIIDIRIPVMDGMAATRYLKAHHPQIKIIIMSELATNEYILQLVKLGANAYLFKSTAGEALKETIRRVMKNEYCFDDDITKLIVKNLTSANKNKLKVNERIGFTDQELKVMTLICEEFTIEEIAKRILVSSRTVEGYRQKILKKTGSKNTAGIVKFALLNGYV